MIYINSDLYIFNCNKQHFKEETKNKYKKMWQKKWIKRRKILSIAINGHHKLSVLFPFSMVLVLGQRVFQERKKCISMAKIIINTTLYFLLWLFFARFFFSLTKWFNGAEYRFVCWSSVIVLNNNIEAYESNLVLHLH